MRLEEKASHRRLNMKRNPNATNLLLNRPGPQCVLTANEFLSTRLREERFWLGSVKPLAAARNFNKGDGGSLIIMRPRSFLLASMFVPQSIDLGRARAHDVI